jgi:hypothetical protein
MVGYAFHVKEHENPLKYISQRTTFKIILKLVLRNAHLATQRT